MGTKDMGTKDIGTIDMGTKGHSNPIEPVARRRTPRPALAGMALAALCLALAPLTPARAEEAPAPATGTATATPEPGIAAYRLAPGDRIAVAVFGQAELSGDYALDGAGRILFPILGPVEVGNLTIADCQTRIIDRLADGILKEPVVFVKIAEMRPIQILGDVRTPGSYPYRYGTVVKGLVALAGGFGISPLSQGSAFSEFLAADERLRVLEASRWRLELRRARLKAQLDRAGTFEPAAQQKGDSTPETLAFVAEEKDAFQARTKEINDALQLIRAQKPALEQERDAIDAQIVSEKKQLDLIGSQITAYEKLAKNGLARLDAMVQMQLTAATKESAIWRLEADRSRLKASIGELDIRLGDAQAAHDRQVSIELQDASQRLHDIAVSMAPAQEQRKVKLREAGATTSAAVKRDITITRLENMQVTTKAAGEATLLEPGDIVEIKMVAGGDAPSSLAAMARDGSPPSKTKTAAAVE